MFKLFTSPLFRKLLLYGSALALVLAAAFSLYTWLRGPKVEIVEGPGKTTYVYVDRPVIQTKEVVKYVEDKAEVERLMKEQAALQAQITVLTEAYFDLEQQGYGKITYVDKIKREGVFEDWHLTFTFKEDEARYTLTQKFEVLAAAGRDKNGKPTATTKLFELGPNGERIPAENTKTTVIAATPGASRWFASPTLIAGAAMTDQPGAVVGVRWLTRGSTKAAEDSKFAVLTPVFFAGKDKELGLLPISYNLGSLPRQPFKDLWVSPYISTKRVGVAVTASF